MVLPSDAVPDDDRDVLLPAQQQGVAAGIAADCYQEGDSPTAASPSRRSCFNRLALTIAADWMISRGSALPSGESSRDWGVR